MTALITLGVQFVVIGLGAAAFWLAKFYGNFWIATGVLLALAAAAFSAYGMVLNGIDGLALQRRESLVGELSRA
jgi:hypothetical protein